MSYVPAARRDPGDRKPGGLSGNLENMACMCMRDLGKSLRGKGTGVLCRIPTLLMAFPAMLLLLSVAVAAQDGEPFMNQFRLEKVPGNRISSISQDIENTMVFSGSTGIITFDAEDWKIFKVPNIPMTVSADTVFPMIYVGGRGFYGYLLKTETGDYVYHNLGEKGEATGDIFRICQTSRYVIYYGDDLVAMADRNELYNLKKYRPDSLNMFGGLLVYRDRAYLNLLGKGIQELTFGGLRPVESRIDFSDTEILFGIEYGDSCALVGLDNNALYRFDGREFSRVRLEDQEYLEESYLVNAAWLEGHVFALSTLLGGCIILDVATGKTINILNYQTGLPDDEIYAIGNDNNHGLWLSHQYGLTRVDVSLPIRGYENYPGLEGNLTAVAVLDSTLYVSTNEGIFCLEEKKDYLEKEIMIRVNPPPPVPAVETKEETVPGTGLEEAPEEPAQEENLSPREIRQLRREARREARHLKTMEKAASDSLEGQGGGSGGESAAESPEPAAGKSSVRTSAGGKSSPGKTSAGLAGAVEDSLTSGPGGREERQKTGGLRSLLQRLSGKPEEIPREEVVEEKSESTPHLRTRYIKQKIYSLQSISHEFTRLGQFDAKAKDLVPVGKRVLISTNEGLYEIVDRELKVIRKDWYVDGIFPTSDPSRIYVVTDGSAYQMILDSNRWVTSRDFSYIPDEVYSACEEDDSTIWLGCDNRAYRISPLNNALYDVRSFDFHEAYYDPVTMRNIRDTVYFFLSGGIYCFRGDSLYRTGILRDQSLSRIYLSTYAMAWARSGDRWLSFGDQENYNERVQTFLNLFEDIADLFLDTEGQVWLIADNKYLYRINPGKLDAYNPDFELYLKNVYNEEKHYRLDQLHFDYYDRSLVFDLSAPFYLRNNSTSYQYYAEGMSEGWSEWKRSGELEFPVLPMGKFTLHIRARNVLNQVTEVRSYPIVIKPPWWLSLPFLFAVGVLLVLVVALIIRWRVRKLRRDKVMLEEKVRERTTEIQRQKDEISDQKKEIMDSIHYARRIQKAVLPSDRKAEQDLPEHFILFLPRDIVSGDFYWISTTRNRTVIAAADCTGHGVPGAFMSMLGVSFLNEIVNKGQRLSAGKILDHLRDYVKDTLSQTERGGTMEGMDIALCILDRNAMTLQYSGAYNPLYLIRQGELTEYKADIMPIGIHIVQETNFRNHTIKVQKGDSFYIFSDGFQDQFGGEEGKKFLSRSMKKLFLEVSGQPMQKQREIIHRILQEWMEGYDQVDDILVLGVRI